MGSGRQSKLSQPAWSVVTCGGYIEDGRIPGAWVCGGRSGPLVHKRQPGAGRGAWWWARIHPLPAATLRPLPMPRAPRGAGPAPTQRCEALSSPVSPFNKRQRCTELLHCFGQDLVEILTLPPDPPPPFPHPAPTARSVGSHPLPERIAFGQSGATSPGRSPSPAPLMSDYTTQG